MSAVVSSVQVVSDTGDQLDSLGDLLAHLEVNTIEEASDVISENLDPDAFIMEHDDGELVLCMDSQGVVLRFPMTVDHFWALVHDLDSDVVAAVEVTSWQDEFGDEVGSLAWDSPALFPRKEPQRVAHYRRLQSWYRERVLHVRPGPYGRYLALGSYLHSQDVAASPGLNFLSEAAQAHAEQRITEVRAEGGSLDPVRLRQNMLSSMPLCFNLFGTMRAEADFFGVFQQLFDPAAIAITEVVCEWAPQPPSQFLGDRTAFDAVVFYETAVGPRFCGIETKYTEPFSATLYDTQRYRDVTRDCGWFNNPDQAGADLKHPKSNQLWRNLMLAAAVEVNGRNLLGSVAVVALADDPGAYGARDIVGRTLAQTERLKSSPLNRSSTPATLCRR